MVWAILCKILIYRSRTFIKIRLRLSLTHSFALAITHFFTVAISHSLRIIIYQTIAILFYPVRRPGMSLNLLGWQLIWNPKKSIEIHTARIFRMRKSWPIRRTISDSAHTKSLDYPVSHGLTLVYRGKNNSGINITIALYWEPSERTHRNEVTVEQNARQYAPKYTAIIRGHEAAQQPLCLQGGGHLAPTRCRQTLLYRIV